MFRARPPKAVPSCDEFRDHQQPSLEYFAARGSDQSRARNDRFGGACADADNHPRAAAQRRTLASTQRQLSFAFGLFCAFGQKNLETAVGCGTAPAAPSCPIGEVTPTQMLTGRSSIRGPRRKLPPSPVVHWLEHYAANAAIARRPSHMDRQLQGPPSSVTAAPRVQNAFANGASRLTKRQPGRAHDEVIARRHDRDGL